jgi:hypothetical protein
MLEPLRRSEHLASLASACGSDSDRLASLGSALGHALSVGDAEILESVNAVDMAGSTAATSPHVDWIVIGKRHSWATPVLQTFPWTLRVFAYPSDQGGWRPAS